MARLIVDEGGRRRAFRVGEGVVTVGSGEAASLRVAAADVADVHVEIVVRGDEAWLRPRPGVLPPRLAGREVRAEIPLPRGVDVQIGAARLRLEAEEGAPAAEAPPAAAAGRAAGAGAVGAAVAPPPVPRSVARRTQPRVRKGLPGPLVALLTLAGAAVLFLFLVIVFKSQERAGPAAATMDVAADLIEHGSLDDAERRLAGLTPADLAPEESARLAALRRQIEELRAQRELDVANIQGSRYLDSKIRLYEQYYLQGEPDVPRIREFLRRTAEFRRRWPRHPELDWVERQESRFRGVVDPSAPPTLADVAWRIECLTKSAPRDYAQAFAALDAFLEGATPAESETGLALREALVSDRAEYHADRMAQAQYELDRQDPSKAVWWLVHGVAEIGDPALADEAARELVKIPDVDAHLRGYQAEYPDLYEALMRNEIVRAAAADLGL